MEGVRILEKNYYDVNDVMKLLGIQKTKAYEIIRREREQLVKDGYAEYPSGKIPKAYFNKRFVLNC